MQKQHFLTLVLFSLATQAQTEYYHIDRLPFDGIQICTQNGTSKDNPSHGIDKPSTNYDLDFGLSAGTKVLAAKDGYVIGLSGNSGRSSNGAHLHFGVHKFSDYFAGKSIPMSIEVNEYNTSNDSVFVRKAKLLTGELETVIDGPAGKRKGFYCKNEPKDWLIKRAEGNHVNAGNGYSSAQIEKGVDLAPGESRWISLKNLTIPTNPGKYYIYTWIKSQQYSLDSNRENDYSNTSDKEEFAKVNVEPLPKPNLNIINVRFRERAYPYVYPKIKFDVKNSINHSKHIGNCKVLVQIFQGSTLKFNSTYFCNLDSLNGANKSITKYLTLKSGRLSAGKYDLRITIDPENVVYESNEYDNVTNHSFVVFPTLKVDLITNAVSFSRANENSPFKVYYNVVNNGNARVTNLIRVFRSGQEKFWKKQCFDNDISANGGTVNKVADVIGLPAGSGYIMKLNVNYGGGYIEESNYSNNETNQVFSVFMSTRPDLIVSNAYAAHKYHVGRHCKFKYYIKNIGNKDFRGSFWVVTTIKGYRGVNQVDNRSFWHQKYITLKTNETRAFTFDLGGLHFGGHKISVKVDNNNQVTELNENNNIRVLNVGVFH